MQKIRQDRAIGHHIQRLRKEKGLTQVQMVMLMHEYDSVISESTYIKIEGGYRNILVSDLAILRHIFQVSYDEFFHGVTVKKDDR